LQLSTSSMRPIDWATIMGAYVHIPFLPRAFHGVHPRSAVQCLEGLRLSPRSRNVAHYLVFKRPSLEVQCSCILTCIVFAPFHNFPLDVVVRRTFRDARNLVAIITPSAPSARGGRERLSVRDPSTVTRVFSPFPRCAG
jgi:hypothetical protein